MGEHAAAARIATSAGELLLALRRELERGIDPRELRDRGDRESHELIVRELRAAYPSDAVLSEEGKDDDARLNSPRVWIVDPLDGTREFGEAGRTDWAVHVALTERGVPIAAAVALPARGLTLTMDAPPPLPTTRHPAPRVIVSRTRPPAVALHVVERLAGTLVEMGSAGAKAMAVALDDADVYVHAGGQYEWDSAAPVGVALAAGLHVSRIDGSAIRYNQPNPWLPDLLICRPELAQATLAALADAPAG